MRHRFLKNELRPTHVVGKCSDKFWPGTVRNEALKEAWSVFSNTINELYFVDHVITNVFVLMSNHYHWICTYDFRKDPDIFLWFHELINQRYSHIGFLDMDLFDEAAHIEKISCAKHYRQVYKYVYRNPVSAGLCQDVLSYPYSTLPIIFDINRNPENDSRPQIICIDNMHTAINAPKTLHWLNSPEPA